MGSRVFQTLRHILKLLLELWVFMGLALERSFFLSLMVSLGPGIGPAALERSLYIAETLH